MCKAKIIIAGEGQEAAAVALNPQAVKAMAGRQPPAQGVLLEMFKLSYSELFKRRHIWDLSARRRQRQSNA
jgi:hypothetical protein